MKFVNIFPLEKLTTIQLEVANYTKIEQLLMVLLLLHIVFILILIMSQHIATSGIIYVHTLTCMCLYTYVTVYTNPCMFVYDLMYACVPVCICTSLYLP